MNENKATLTDRFTAVAAKIANITYLKILRDAFQVIMPMFILAGIGTLLNSVIFPALTNGDLLAKLQVFGTLISNATLNISAMLVAPMISYYLAKARKFDSPMSAVIVTIGSLFAIMPIINQATIKGTDKVTEVIGVVTFDKIGTNGMFAGIIIGFVATEIFIKLSKLKALKINLGQGIPPAVATSFELMIPIFITILIICLVSTLLVDLWNTSVIDFITMAIQKPLTKVGNSFIGFTFLFALANFVFSIGIHPSTITSSIMKAPLMVAMNENMTAAAAGRQAPNIINYSFRLVFGQMGGTGATLGLLIAILLFTKYKPFKQVSKLALAPAIFNINEPIVFGLPVVFNVSLMIPFVLGPIIGTTIGYVMTAIGFIKPLTVLVPWTIPPFVNGFLASGGDWKVVLVQIIIVAVHVILYLPFLKVSEKIAKQQVD
ncbi:PTS transporter subunit EIIC [Lactobacillus sp. IBH004]|uniref:PTS sugar transporter subunit IIC n=1 Tax=Lactobacillus sp. IBH004 TaxID=2879107 RepID=UPI00224491A4|nr:PTS transporter subunit EIIC [Lactobacillus sp. IBH004]MCT6889613.1 PTS transporter subunit EIIC [Lactobacillus sp.]UZN42694.1 PTS transporter subunit EIIC [Lactobacillus sp. IBH004]